jgi:hypothetical protein
MRLSRGSRIALVVALVIIVLSLGCAGLFYFLAMRGIAMGLRGNG